MPKLSNRYGPFSSDEKSASDRKFPLFHFKTDGRNIEVTFGPSLAGILIALATTKLGFIATALAVLSCGGAVLIGWVAIRRMR